MSMDFCMPFWRSATSHFTQHMCVFYTNHDTNTVHDASVSVQLLECDNPHADHLGR